MDENSTVKKKQRRNEEDLNQKLRPFTYQELSLSDEFKNKLKKPIITTTDMTERYDLIMNIFELYKPNLDGQILQLPNLSLLNIDQSRFKFDNHLIKIVNRIDTDKDMNTKIVDTYLNELEKVDLEEVNYLYLYGLKGIGKSFIIYHMVAKLMQMKDKYRVIYINQASSSIILDTLKVLKTIFIYESSQKEYHFTYQSWLNSQMKDDKLFNFFKKEDVYNDLEFAQRVIEDISLLYYNKNLKLIFVFDQINLILKNSELKNQRNF